MKVYLTLFLIYTSLLSFGQKRNVPFSTTKNFITRRIGLVFPFLDQDDKSYNISNQSIGYGLNAGFEFGHSFSPRFSGSFSVLLMYLKFSDTDIHIEYMPYGENFIARELNGNFHYYNFGALIPIDFNFEIDDKLTFTLGLYIQKPFLDRQYSTLSEIEYYHRSSIGQYFKYNTPLMHSPFDRVYKNWRSDPRAGVHLQYSFLLKAKDWEQKRINVEYYHSFIKPDFEVYEQWFQLTYRKVMFQ
ncbi:MAG: hypothetical protein ABJB16_04910 [Saprospiraceae bacterium]